MDLGIGKDAPRIDEKGIPRRLGGDAAGERDQPPGPLAAPHVGRDDRKQDGLVGDPAHAIDIGGERHRRDRPAASVEGAVPLRITSRPEMLIAAQSWPWATRRSATSVVRRRSIAPERTKKATSASRTVATSPPRSHLRQLAISLVRIPLPPGDSRAAGSRGASEHASIQSQNATNLWAEQCRLRPPFEAGRSQGCRPAGSHAPCPLHRHGGPGPRSAASSRAAASLLGDGCERATAQ